MVVVCVYFLICRVPSAVYENHQNARAHFSRRGIVIHLLIFHFFLSPMTGAFAKSSHIRAKLLCGSFEQNSGMG